MNPRDVLLVMKFMQELHEKGLILDFQVNHTKPSMFLGFAHHVPCSQGVAFFTLLSFLVPEASASDLVEYFN